MLLQGVTVQHESDGYLSQYVIFVVIHLDASEREHPKVESPIY